MRNKISVVIQGPLDDRTYEAIDTYQDFNEVIVSTWNNEDLSLLNKASGKYQIVQSYYPKDYNNANGWQAMTTMTGAIFAKSKYVLKTRTDELYPDLSMMIDNVKTYPDRSHTTNNGFWRNYRHCYSCHLFLDKRDFIVDAMQEMVNYYIDDKNRLQLPNFESALGYFLMRQRGYTLNDTNWKDIFRNEIYITPCCDLPNHLHSGATTATHVEGFKRSSLPYPNGRMETSSNKHDVGQLYSDVREI